MRLALLRRRTPAPEETAAPEDGRIRFGAFVLDLAGCKLRRLDGNEVKLTAMEFDLLALFASRPGRVLSREQILDLAHNKEEEPFDRSVDIRIARLRRKLEIDRTKPVHIKTVRGAGYIFER